MARNNRNDEAVGAEAPLPSPGPEIDPDTVSVDPNAPLDIDPDWTSGAIQPGAIADQGAYEQAVADGRISEMVQAQAPRYVVVHTVVGPAWTRGQHVPANHGLEDSQVKRLLRIGAIAPADSPEAQEALASPHRLGLDEED